MCAPQNLEGFVAGDDPIAYVIDAYDREIERVRELAEEHPDETRALLIKLTEGQKPKSQADKERAEELFQGALELIRIAAAAGWRWGVYHYGTLGRDGKTVLWDPVLEAEWAVATYIRLLEAAAAEGLPAPSIRFCLDLEDKRRPLARAQRALWAHTFLAYIHAALGHRPMLYVGTSYARRELGADHGLGVYPLWQAHYHDNDPDRRLVAPQMPAGWRTRAGWQFTSLYRDGLDRSVFRLSAVLIPGAQP